MSDQNLLHERLLVPAGQSVFIGSICGSAAMIAGIIWSWPAPVGVGGLAWLGVTGFSFLVFKDSWKPEPPPPPQPARQYETSVPTFKLNISWDGGHSGDLSARLGCTWDQFVTWCTRVSAGGSLGETHWTGSKGIFSKGEYISFRDRCAHYGLVKQRARHYSSGYVLSEKGRAVTAEVARRFGQPGQPSPAARRYTPDA